MNLDLIFQFPNSSLQVIAPDRPLMRESMQLTVPGAQFSDWSRKEHLYSYMLMRHIAQNWQKTGLTEQYLIYGKIDSKIFNWEIVPYQKCGSFFGRSVQQLQVLWRTVFGGIVISNEKKKNQIEKYKEVFEEEFELIESSSSGVKGKDAFCNDERIDKQWVITGEKVRVLFNYAPIGFGGEKLHFLVVPMEHREKFSDVTQEEYSECLQLTQKLFTHFKEVRANIENVYLLNKTGVDTGQTVNHWHLNVIFSTNKSQDFWGKITVVRNILLGSSPMKEKDLAETVGALRLELSLEDK